MKTLGNHKGLPPESRAGLTRGRTQHRGWTSVLRLQTRGSVTHPAGGAGGPGRFLQTWETPGQVTEGRAVGVA